MNINTEGKIMARIVINVIDRITGSGLQRYTVFVFIYVRILVFSYVN